MVFTCDYGTLVSEQFHRTGDRRVIPQKTTVKDARRQVFMAELKLELENNLCDLSLLRKVKPLIINLYAVKLVASMEI